MTQSNLLELAKQGDPQAIATLMNRSLQPKGITAHAELQGDRLLVLLEAQQVPNRQAMTTFVQNGIVSLGLNSIRSLKILGQQSGATNLAWEQEVYLGVPVSSSESVAAEPIATPPRPAAPPPPPRPAPPPVPPFRSVAPPPPPTPAVEEVAPLPNERPVPVADTSGNPIENGKVQDIEPSQDAAAIAPELLDPHGESHPDSVIDDPDAHADLAAAPTPRTRSRRSPWIFVVLLLMVGWVGAIVGYALWKDITTPSPQPEPLPTSPVSGEPTTSATVATPNPQASPTRSPGSYASAIEQGTQAATLEQSAQSADDWGLVVSQWQQAIAILQAVPATSSDYAAAQARLPEYQASLAAAQQRAASQPNASDAPAPSTTFTVSSDITCAAVASTPQSQPVELTNVQFGGDASTYVVGCITNHTDQPLANVSISYQGGSTENPNLIQSGYSALSFSDLAPQQTVPFRGTFEVSPEVTNLNIGKIYWTPPTASEPQEIPATIALTRPTTP